MFKRVLIIATVAMTLTGCVPAGGVPGFEFAGTFGQPTGSHPSQSNAVITRTDATPDAGSAGACTVAPVGVCGGCSATCDAGQPARCASGVTRYAAPGSGRAATCTREAVCACG